MTGPGAIRARFFLMAHVTMWHALILTLEFL